MRALLVIGLLLLKPGQALLAQDFVISEFMALNLTTLQDDDGDWSDWIEVHNQAGVAASLAGWALSDDGANPFLWVFPAVTVPAGGHVVVFASGKDRTTPGQPLHTSFKLDGAGEYLALTHPGGATSTAFAPFPPQRADFSYGLSGVQRRVLADGAPCFATVPSNGSLGSTWTHPSSPPAGWIAGRTGVGYETVSLYNQYIDTDLLSQMHGVNASAYVVVPFNVPDLVDGWTALTLRMRYDDGFVAYVNGLKVASVNAPPNPQWDSAATAEHPDPQAVLFENFNVTDGLSSIASGQNWLAVQGLNLSANNVDFLMTPELLLGSYAEDRAYQVKPSPGTMNDEGFQAFTATPTFSPPASLADQPFQAAITTASPNAVIRFTVDGTAPTLTNGTIYTGPITISDTTVLRAAAWGPALGPSRVATRTWIFPASVVTQPANPAGLPSTWGTHITTSGQTFVANADYGMDGSVATATEIEQSLRSLPALCFTMDPADLWSETQGLYANPETDWERAASVELIYPNGEPGAQIDCGIQNHGHGSRLPWLTPKHGFRLFFREAYGADRLEYPVFGRHAGASFDTLVIKGGFNDAFTITLPSHDLAIYCRDEYVRRMQRRMGHASPHGTWVHLYLNGLYWGLYHPIERPDGVFQETYHGGDADDYDVIKHKYAELVQGNLNAWNTLYGLAGPSTSAWNAVQPYLDTVNFVDYFLLNIYMGTGDWMPNNWYGARLQEPGAGYRMFVWDAELALKSEDRTGLAVPNTPAYVYSQLKGNAEFQTLFGDRAQKFLFDNGPLTPARAQAALQEEADRIDPAIVAESARWGDWLPSHATFTRASSWQPALQGHLGYLGTRRDVVVGLLQNAGLYPTVAAPTLSQHGGSIGSGFQLTISAPSGSIMYTLDGSDPRSVGGGVSSTAQMYASPVSITAPATTVKARVLDNGSWSALVEARFVRDFVVINEFLASNNTNIADEAGDFDDWIELTNPTSSALSLGGFWLTDDMAVPMKWQLPDVTIEPGRSVLVWADDEPLEGALHATFKLSAGGEAVALFMPDGYTVVDAITFGPQLSDVSTGRFTDGSGMWVTFPRPTPRSRNEVVGCSRTYTGLDPTAYPMRLLMTGAARPGGTITFTTGNAPPGVTHNIIASWVPTQASLATPPGSLLIGPNHVLLSAQTASVFGSTSFSVNIPNLPSMVGGRVFLQAWSEPLPGALIVSNALEVVVCPR